MDLAQAWCSLFYSWRSQVPRRERTRSHGSFMANPGLIPISLPSPVSFISKTLPLLTVVALLRGVGFWGAFISLFSLRRDLCRMVISCCSCHLFPPWVDIKTETEVEIATEIEIDKLLGKYSKGWGCQTANSMKAGTHLTFLPHVLGT